MLRECTAPAFGSGHCAWIEMTRRPFRPIVIGSPRSGFALLCSVLSELSRLGAPKADLRQGLLNLAVARLGDHISEQIVAAFEQEGLAQDLVYNGNFRVLTGGPHWADRGGTPRACFRKYIGARGLGDVVLAIAHPLELLECDAVVHSHVDPAWWPEQPFLQQHSFHASVRNPAGIVNSACFSLNALASEHIQRFLAPDQDNDRIRQELALYKLSDPKFFEGIVRYYVRYFEEFVPVRTRYAVMRWEDLISDPAPTIQAVARAAGTPIGPEFAAQIWARLDHRNLTGDHRHNYRAGKGIIGDWRNWLTNHHIETMRRAGLQEAALQFGYERFAAIDESTYTPFQLQLDRLIREGSIHQPDVDADLFGYAFNKSNIDASKFGFRQHEWRTHTRIERSSMRSAAVEMKISDVAEAAAARLNGLFEQLLRIPCSCEEATLAHLRRLRDDHAASVRVHLPARYDAWFVEAEALVREAFQVDGFVATLSDRRAPLLLYSMGTYNLVAHAGRFLGIPQALGPIDLEREQVTGRAGVLITDSLQELEGRLQGQSPTSRNG
jgi:hypothetical protein